MPLPELDSHGDLPIGVHQASLDEVIAYFGHGTPQPQLVTKRLLRIYDLARGTGKLERFVIFGSYVTAKPNPNDVDIILIMRSEEHTSELQSQFHLVCRLLLEKKKKKKNKK